uniref:Neuromedin-B n=1 Tax=Scophthalmus maximus TaxID=52904 RepID=A0A8D2ZFH1_SCOMX
MTAPTSVVNAGLLSSLILISYFAMTSSMTLDLTELRNKVSKIKVNPRGNLWATGHFMGKKSVVDGSAFEDVSVPSGVRAVSPLHRVGDLQALLIQMLETARGTHEKHKPFPSTILLMKRKNNSMFEGFF